MENNLINIKDLSKETIYEGKEKYIFDKFNLEIISEKNRIDTFLSFDKSASILFNLIGGVETFTEGEIDTNSSSAIYIPTKPSAYPWLDVEENLKYVLNKSLYSTENKKNKIQEIINLVGLNGYEKHIPNNKSFGFRLRISIARALILSPKLILIDNSFSILDSETKFEMYEMIKEIVVKTNTSFFIASSDLNETIYLSENVYLMKGEKIEIFDKINLLEESSKLSIEQRKSRQEIIRELIIKKFYSKGVSNILSCK